jgi:uncharacterized membrane protein
MTGPRHFGRAGDAAEPGERSGEAEGPSLSFERIIFFSDAVFAIVITLLVLPLTTEIEARGPGGAAQVAIELWPRVLTFVVSFLVIGQFWVAHHRLFAYLHTYDYRLVWLNIISLLAVAFMPFPAAMLGAQSAARDRFPVVFYAASMTVISAFLTVLWVYAVRRQLVDDSLPHRQVTEFTVRAVTTTAVFLLSTAVAFLGLPAAIIVWLVVLPAARIVAVRCFRASGDTAASPA